MDQIAPTIIAHRGLHTHLPENSIAAFRAARESGVEWIEFDVQQSLNGFPVIIHDETLDRMTTVTGRVDRARSDQIRQMHFVDSTDRVPVLAAGPNPLAGLGARFLVEIKPPDAPQLVSRTAAAMRSAHVDWIIQAFDRANLQHALRAAPGVEQALLIDRSIDLLAALKEGWPAVHVAHSLVDDVVVGMLRKRGIKVGVWTVNERADLCRMIKLGVDRIITDAPILAMSLLDE